MIFSDLRLPSFINSFALSLASATYLSASSKYPSVLDLISYLNSLPLLGAYNKAITAPIAPPVSKPRIKPLPKLFSLDILTPLFSII